MCREASVAVNDCRSVAITKGCVRVKVSLARMHGTSQFFH